MPSTRYTQIERRLGHPLAEYVQKRREQGMSWRTIANNLLLETGEDISYDRLRTWFTEPESDSAGRVTVA